MDPINLLISVLVRMGVRPRFTSYVGPLTEMAGFALMTCPVTSQLNSTRIAARCCLIVGFSNALARLRDIYGHVERLDGREVSYVLTVAPSQESATSAVVRIACVLVADRNSEEFDELFDCLLISPPDDRWDCQRDFISEVKNVSSQTPLNNDTDRWQCDCSRNVRNIKMVMCRLTSRTTLQACCK